MPVPGMNRVGSKLQPASSGSLLQALSEIGRSQGDVEALTHARFDHIGFAERARKELRVPVWVHENAAPLSKHPILYTSERSPLLYLKPATLLIMSSWVRAGVLLVRSIREVFRFRDEGTLDVPGYPRILFTPGHTLGPCALHLPERSVLISGDALVTHDPYINPGSADRRAGGDRRQQAGARIARPLFGGGCGNTPAWPRRALDRHGSTRRDGGSPRRPPLGSRFVKFMEITRAGPASTVVRAHALRLDKSLIGE